MIWTKGAHQSAKFQTFDCSRKISPNLYFGRLLSLKVYKISAKNAQKIYVLWPSKISTLIGSYCAKYSMFDLKKYRGVISHDTEKWCKIWKKTDLWFGKWHEDFGKFSLEHQKVSKLGLWWDPFVQSRKRMSLKFAEGLCVMKMKNYTKIEEELTCHFKIGIKNLTIFDPSTRKSPKFAL